MVKVVPGGMTPILQPLDTHLNKSLKSKMRQIWSDWMLHGEVELTKSGKRRRMSYEHICVGIAESVKEIEREDSELIIRR